LLVSPETLAYANLAFVLALYLHFIFGVVHDITSHLGIPVLTLPPKEKLNFVPEDKKHSYPCLCGKQAPAVTPAPAPAPDNKPKTS
jgi:hypothetical protein